MSDTSTAADPNEKLAITHPNVAGNGEVTRRQFEAVWEPLGYTIVGPADEVPDTADRLAELNARYTASPDSLTRDELAELTHLRGLTADGRTIAAYRAALDA